MPTMDSTKMDLENIMIIAIDEAKASLREGNSGFGAVMAKAGRILTILYPQ
jgi:hypothetical protein